MADWTDSIVGERMQLDKEFNERVDASEFTRQQWGLIMTAVEFDIRQAGDDQEAKLVAETSKLPSIMPELDKIEQARGGAMGGGGQPPGGSAGGGGLLDGVKDALGLGGDSGNDERQEAAAALAQQYADELQSKLEHRGKWETVCETARTD
jgi:hypothetical protein